MLLGLGHKYIWLMNHFSPFRVKRPTIHNYIFTVFNEASHQISGIIGEIYSCASQFILVLGPHKFFGLLSCDFYPIENYS